MHTPYFPPWRSRLSALGGRAAQAVRQTTLAQLQQHLRDLLPEPLLSSTDEGLNCRDRVFNLRLTFECFIWQLLQPRTACREVVRPVQALFLLHGLGPVSAGDSACVQARQRLPRDRFERALAATARAAQARARPPSALQSRPVKVVDGSSTQLADTEENQRRYPQPSTQKPGCGFPVMKLAVLFCLNTGVVLHVILDRLHSHDLRLLRRLAGNDGLLVWTKGCQQSKILTVQEWGLLPAQITVRIIRFKATLRGFRTRRITLVTTLLDAALYPAAEIAALYARRWRLELCLRDLKTTMGMDELLCKSPDMAEKELYAYLMAHHLIRCVMAEAVAQHSVDLERLSFKGTVDAVRQYSAAIAQAHNRKLRGQLWEDLLLTLARDLVRLRPGRQEPRAIKRRPKPYPLLNRPRRKFVEISHRSRYWKGRPRNYSALN